MAFKVSMLKLRQNISIMTKNKKCTIIISGGLDSTVLLYYTRSTTSSQNIHTLSFNYGQKHVKELIYAQKLGKTLGIENTIINISSVGELLNSSLTKKGEKIPEGHYAQKNMRLTVVPNRNAIMLSIAYGYAISNKSDYLIYGAHTGDHFIYPDCRLPFVKTLNCALRLGNKSFGNVTIITPFINKTKSDLVKIGLKLNVPFDKTWSCYNGGEKPCLKCGTCIERIEAFKENNIKDPLLSDQEWKLALINYERTKTVYQKGHK